MSETKEDAAAYVERYLPGSGTITRVIVTDRTSAVENLDAYLRLWPVRGAERMVFDFLNTNIPSSIWVERARASPEMEDGCNPDASKTLPTWVVPEGLLFVTVGWAEITPESSINPGGRPNLELFGNPVNIGKSFVILNHGAPGDVDPNLYYHSAIQAFESIRGRLHAVLTRISGI